MESEIHTKLKELVNELGVRRSDLHAFLGDRLRERLAIPEDPATDPESVRLTVEAHLNGLAHDLMLSRQDQTIMRAAFNMVVPPIPAPDDRSKMARLRWLEKQELAFDASVSTSRRHLGKAILPELARRLESDEPLPPDNAERTGFPSKDAAEPATYGSKEAIDSPAVQSFDEPISDIGCWGNPPAGA